VIVGPPAAYRQGLGSRAGAVMHRHGERLRVGLTSIWTAAAGDAFDGDGNSARLGVSRRGCSKTYVCFLVVAVTW